MLPYNVLPSFQPKSAQNGVHFFTRGPERTHTHAHTHTQNSITIKCYATVTYDTSIRKTASPAPFWHGICLYASRCPQSAGTVGATQGVSASRRAWRRPTGLLTHALRTGVLGHPPKCASAGISWAGRLLPHKLRARPSGGSR